jgi:hypothetical protein
MDNNPYYNGFRTGTLDPSTLMAALTTPPLTYGDHGFTAVFSGDSFFQPSTAPTVVVSVATPNIAGTLTVTGSNSAIVGSLYTLTLPESVNSTTITAWAVNWGDGYADSPSSMSSDTHTYLGSGNFAIQAVATAGGKADLESKWKETT